MYDESEVKEERPYQNSLYFNENNKIINDNNSNNTILTEKINNNNSVNNNEKNNINNSKEPTLTMRVRNRRYKKLLELRKEGYFDEEAIKLRHPLLFYSFVGQYQYNYEISEQFNTKTTINSLPINICDKRTTTYNNKMEEEQEHNNKFEQENSNPSIKNNNITSSFSHSEEQHQLGLSTFLESHLINMEYNKMLDREMSREMEEKLLKENEVNEKQIEEMRGIGESIRKGNDKWANENYCYFGGNYQQQVIYEHEEEEQMEMELEMESEKHEIDDYYSKNNNNNISNKNNNNKISNTEEIISKQNNNNHHIINKINKLSTYTPTEEEINSIRENYYRTSSAINEHEHLQGDINYEFNNEYIHKINNEKKLLSLEEKEIQEQHLIEYCEELFLEGKLNYKQHMIDYNQIDNNEEYDDVDEENRDLEERYFNEDVEDNSEEEEESNNETNKNNNSEFVNEYETGVQDY